MRDKSEDQVVDCPHREPFRQERAHRGKTHGEFRGSGRPVDSGNGFRSFGAGLYQHGACGTWYERPWIDGKRTWRKLEARTQKEARQELIARRADQARSKLGLAVNPYAMGRTLSDVLDCYARAGFLNKHRQGRPEKARLTEERNVANLQRLLGMVAVERFAIPDCDRYADIRRRECADRGREGSRTVDMELQTLSNALGAAVRAGLILSNPLSNARPRYRSAASARKSRDLAPESGTELHRLAFALAEDERGWGEVLAWQLIFAALSGCRTSEILRLRRNAPSRKPGNIEGDWLWIERSKKGVNPFVLLHQDLRDAIAGHQDWLQRRFPQSPWWFPSPRVPGEPVDDTSLAHALARIAKGLGLDHRTPHGLRAYFVTVRRSQGISDGQIAAEIGDRSVALIASTYGQVPPAWRGGPGLSWRPAPGEKTFWDHALGQGS